VIAVEIVVGISERKIPQDKSTPLLQTSVSKTFRKSNSKYKTGQDERPAAAVTLSQGTVTNREQPVAPVRPRTL